jgi:hypothetical protein
MKLKIALSFILLATLYTACSTSSTVKLPPQTSAEGVDLELQTDNYIRVTDHKNGYTFLLSGDWYPVLQGFQAVKDASNTIAKADPEIANLLESHLNDRHYRVMAFNQNKNYRDKTMVLNLYIQVDTMFSGLSLDKAMKLFAGGSPLQGVAINKNNIEYGYMSGETAREMGGSSVKIHTTVFLIPLDDGHAFFYLFMPISAAESSKDIIKELIDSFELLKE